MYKSNLDFLDHIPIGMFVLDENFVVLFWNSCLEDWTEVTRTTIVGQDIGLYYPHLKAPKYVQRLNNIFSGGPPVIFSAQLHKYIIPIAQPNGQFRLQHTTVTAIPTPDSMCFLALFALQDHTDLIHRIQEYRMMRDQALAEAREREQAQEELKIAKEVAEAANRAKSVFLANMSHELRTPLNAILGFSQLMDKDKNLTAEQKDNIKIINRSGQHLLSLINDVLDMSKIEAGRVVLQEHAFNLVTLIQELIDMFKLRAENKGIWLFSDFPANLPHYVEMDEHKLRQIIINLLSNAIKFTDSGGVNLLIEYETPAKLLHFLVQDTGPGLSAEDSKIIFDPFVQVANAANAKKELAGTGLGLAISRQFAQLMGGELTVTSQVGVGSTFILTLPAKLADSAIILEEECPQQVIGMMPGQPVYRLLIAEDKELNRRLLVKILSQFGFELREAVNGQEAVDICNDWQPHLIWMDIHMPVMDGFEAAKRIKAAGHSAVIVAVTASAFASEQQNILAAGFDDVVLKPYRECELFEKLTQHLGARFLYATETNASIEPLPADTAKMLAATPPAWRNDLARTIMNAEFHTCINLINRIKEQHPAAAEILTTMIHNFEYEAVLALIQPTQE